MNRNGAIEQAARKLQLQKLGGYGIDANTWVELGEALAMPKDVERVAKRKLSNAPCNICGYNGVGYYQPETHPCAAHPPKADAERVALLAEVEYWLKPPTFGKDTPAWATLNRIRAYLQGGDA